MGKTLLYRNGIMSCRANERTGTFTAGEGNHKNEEVW
jgi:hypothetical protein